MEARLGRRRMPRVSPPAGVLSGLLQDDNVAVGITDDDFGGPRLSLWRAVEVDAAGVQSLVFGVEVVAGQHEPAQ